MLAIAADVASATISVGETRAGTHSASSGARRSASWSSCSRRGISPYLTSVNAVVAGARVAGHTRWCSSTPHQTPLCAERYQEALSTRPDVPPERLPAPASQPRPGARLGLMRDARSRLRCVHRLGRRRARSVQSVRSSTRFAGMRAGTRRQGSGLRASRTRISTTRPRHLVDGACFNSGQSCCGIERIYVHSGRIPRRVRRQGFVARIMRGYTAGRPDGSRRRDLGPLVRSIRGRLRAQHRSRKPLSAGAVAHVDAALRLPNAQTSRIRPTCAPQVC